MYIRRVATRRRCKSQPCLPISHVDVDISAERPNKEPMGVLRRAVEGTMGMGAYNQRRIEHVSVVENANKSSGCVVAYNVYLQNSMAAVWQQ